MEFNFNNVLEYQLEITTACNASCPQCPRTINGGKVNPYLQVKHLPRHVIDNAFTSEICNNLKRVFFCGSYGDPIVHPHFLEILQDFRSKNKKLWLFAHTNGSVHNEDYWKEIATIFNNYGHIDFNIDGLSDTNHIYRKNTNFDQIINNATSFIHNGGKANWNFIVYKHNEHQVSEARHLANELGFSEFNVRPTGRFLNHKDLEEISSWPIYNIKNIQKGKLEIPTQAEYRNKSMTLLPKLKDEMDMTEYFNTTNILCDSLNKHHANNNYNKQNEIKVVINADGWVMPCNFFNHNLYDARFYNRNILPSSNDLSFLPSGRTQIRDLFERHNAHEQLNITHTPLPTIFKSPFWKEISDSFSKTLNNGRLFECSLTCGDKLHKVWDQTPMNETFLVTGGNRGLGLEIVNYFNGTSVSRSNKHSLDITNPDHIDEIAEKSLDYDVFVNCAFDGPPGEPWANFGQVNLLVKIYDLWKQHNKSGNIINIGSVGEKTIIAPEPSFERYRVTKAALAHASKQCTTAFRDNLVTFKTSLLSIDRLDTPITRSRESWTGNGLDCNDVIKSIEYILSINNNTCIEEITTWINYNFEE